MQTELLEEERDAWKASTRQVEASVIALAQQCSALEKDLSAIRQAWRSLTGKDFSTAKKDFAEPLSPKPSAPQPLQRPESTAAPTPSSSTTSAVRPSSPSRSLPKMTGNANVDISKSGCSKCNQHPVVLI